MIVRAVSLLCAAAVFSAPASAQIVGSLDNFDFFNDTGEIAEGFEMEIEDIGPADLTRAFPSNFSSQPWVSRFGIPTITSFDNSATGGHRGLKVRWAATWNGTQWIAQYGDYAQPNGPAAGNGVKYVANPTLTRGDACWLLGQGAYYATSGCDHFGVSFAAGIRPAVVRYNWLVPDKANVGTLKASPWAGGTGPLPPAPVQAYLPPPVAGQPGVVQAVAEAPEKPDPADPQWGNAIWAKTYTSRAPAAVDLDALQANVVPKRATRTVKVVIKWSLLQRPPAGAQNEALEKKEVDEDSLPANAALVRRYEYFRYNGLYDPETHEAVCAPEPAGTNGPCDKPLTYKYTNPATGLIKTINERGKYMDAHNEGYNPPA